MVLSISSHHCDLTRLVLRLPRRPHSGHKVSSGLNTKMPSDQDVPLCCFFSFCTFTQTSNKTQRGALDGSCWARGKVNPLPSAWTIGPSSCHGTGQAPCEQSVPNVPQNGECSLFRLNLIDLHDLCFSRCHSVFDHQWCRSGSPCGCREQRFHVSLKSCTRSLRSRSFKNIMA